MRIQKAVVWFFLGTLLVVLFLADLASGSVQISPAEIIRIFISGSKTESVTREIIMDFRLTKAITCVFAGSALSLAGLQMQTMFRNPLAGPDVLGLTSGAGLAVALLFMGDASLPDFLSLTPWTVAITAAIGCAAIFIVMLGVANRLHDNASLLIVGLMIGAGTASVISVLQFLSKAEEMQVYIIWTFGSLGNLAWAEIAVLGLALVAGLLLAIANVKALNAWFLGEQYASTVGIRVKRARILIILSTCLLTGAVTALCGPIVFVGLAIPHLVRMLFRTSDHRILIPAAVVGGSALLLFCDVLAQAPESYVLPVNAITALIGAPVVIWVILRNKFLHPL